jgi:L-seryl-tRNA(Ser) seleniumtransferase
VLARETAVPYFYDVGSGLLLDLSPWGLTGEPRVADGAAAGADLVIFSGDKLLGGPQAGCLAGGALAVAACRRSPLARALRADKLTLAALEATLALYAEPAAAVREIPVLAMLTADAAEIRSRAEELARACPPELRAELRAGESAVGGGAFPAARLPTTLIALDPGMLGPDGLALRLRIGDPPIVARVAEGRVLLDPRTLPRDAGPAVAGALAAALTD